MNFASLAQGGQVLRLIHEQETTVEQLQDLIESGLLSDLLKADVKKVNRDDFRKLLGLTFPELKIIVDYTKTLQEMIAAGHYDWANDDITAKRFPVQGEGKQELIAELVYFGRDMSTQTVEAELKKRCLRPATIAELLAFGESFPEVQRDFPIVAPGSVVEFDGERGVPCLYESDSGRGLNLYCDSNDWNGGYRFLAFRK